MLRWPAVAIVMFVGVASGCGDHSSTDAPRTLTPFTVWVLDRRLTLDGQDQPVANVHVLFDPAAGDRVTQTTASDGHVTFAADFTGGPGAVTVISPDHVLLTMLETSPASVAARPNAAGKPASDLVVFPPRNDAVTQSLTVDLSGNIVGKLDPANQVALFTSALERLGTVQTADPTYDVRAPSGSAFFVLGHELTSAIDENDVVISNVLHRSFRIDLPARTDDERLDLDLATITTLPAHPLHFHAVSPGGSFGVGTRAYASVLSADSGITPGVFASTAPSTDGTSFDVTVQAVDTDITPERISTQAVLVAPDGSRSTRNELGVSSDGTAFADFTLPPSIAIADASLAVNDPIPLDGFPAGADLAVQLVASGELVWLLYGPPGGPHGKSFTIPHQDEVEFDKDAALFALSVAACTDLVPLPPRGELYRHVATYRDVILRRQ